MDFNPKFHTSQKYWYLRQCYLPVPMDKPLLLERMVLEFNTFSEEKNSVVKYYIAVGKKKED